MLEVSYPCITNPSATESFDSVRLACLIHAVSIQSEPRSNSHRKNKNLENLCSSPNLLGFYYVTVIPSHTSSIIHACTLSLLYCQNILQMLMASALSLSYSSLFF